MNVRLLYKSKDFKTENDDSVRLNVLYQDLQIPVILKAMAKGDAFIEDVATKVLGAHLINTDEIVYRQDILRDALANRAHFHRIYEIVVQTITDERHDFWYSIRDSASSTLDRSINVMDMFVKRLRELRETVQIIRANSRSEGVAALAAYFQEELSEAYLAQIKEQIHRLKFNSGMLFSVGVGTALKGVDFLLLRERREKGDWFHHFIDSFSGKHTFHIADRDESGAKALSELKDRVLFSAANVLSQSVNHVLTFFKELKFESAFYAGCINLAEAMEELGVGYSFPEISPVGSAATSYRDLCNPSLALTRSITPTGCDGDFKGAKMVVITGVNQGGKTTFLRSIGVAQIMGQCGMYVTAERYRSPAYANIFSHFKREEDSEFKSGKLDEELTRMSGIVDSIAPNSLLLMNESFASTNDYEGSEIMRQVVTAFLDRDITVYNVTHLYEFAKNMHTAGRSDTAFLVAERLADGKNTMKMIPGLPKATAFGKDVYSAIFTA